MKSKTYKNKEEAYVEFIYSKKENDTKMKSAFRRAMNPLCSYAVWEYIIPFMGEHFQIDKYRSAYILIPKSLH